MIAHELPISNPVFREKHTGSVVELNGPCVELIAESFQEKFLETNDEGNDDTKKKFMVGYI